MICPACEFENATSVSVCARCGSELSGRPARLIPDESTNIAVFSLHKSQVTIGRSPENDFYLEDQSVSRRHASIRAVEDGYIIKDNASRHGTAINGHKIESHRLQDGDHIKIGVYPFRFADQEGSYQDASTLALKEVDHLRRVWTFVVDLHARAAEAHDTGQHGTHTNSIASCWSRRYAGRFSELRSPWCRPFDSGMDGPQRSYSLSDRTRTPF